jgi:dUTP pyrophosphatase
MYIYYEGQISGEIYLNTIHSVLYIYFMKLNIKLLNDDGKIPVYGSTYAAGIDVYSSVDCDVLPKSRKLISTGISVSWSGEDSDKYYLRIAPRSGLSVKHNIDIGAGVIDYDYRGEIFVCFINSSNEETYSIKKNDKIAQMILTRIEKFDEINIVEGLDETERNDKGFGSTGV